jgi:P pilus assembly chaperone PapD
VIVNGDWEKWLIKAVTQKIMIRKNKIIFSAALIQSCFILMAFFSQDIYAALIVNRSIITYDNPSVNREDVVIINSDQQANLYIQVDPFKVVNAGQESQELLVLDITDNPEFLVTPNRLVIAPGGRSLVRFLNLLPPAEEERIYRVNLTPITPPAEYGTGNAEEIRSRLEVVVAYQILVIILPDTPNPEMRMNRDGILASFTNTGNSNYLLTDGQQCDPENPVICQPLEDRRVYSGNNWQLTLPYDGPFTYTVRTQTGLTSEYFQ